MILDIIAFSVAFTMIFTSITCCKKIVYLQVFIIVLLVESVFVACGLQMFSLLPVMVAEAFLAYRQERKLYDSLFSASLTVILLTIGVTIAAIPLTSIIPQGGLYNYSMSVLVVLYSILCRKLLKMYFPHRVLQDSAVLVIMSVTGAAIVVFISVIAPLFLLYSMETLPFYLLFTVFLVFVVAFSVYANRMESEKNRKEYNRIIEKQYAEINSFKHYYGKLYRSLHRYVREKDMEGIMGIFYQYIVPEHMEHIENGVDYGMLAMVKLPLINGLLYDTVTSLRQKDIPFNLYIEGTIATGNITELDLFMILTHLIGNAVEETENQDKGYINIFLSEDVGGTDVRIENTLEGSIDIPLVYKEGYTTKENHAGFGLPEVRRIADCYPNVTLSTYRQFGLFIQYLSIE